MKEEYLYKEPVRDIASKINDSFQNVILLGNFKSGKSTVLNEYINNYSTQKNPIINGTTRFSEYFNFRDNEVFKLYHTCLIVKKIINQLNSSYENIGAEIELYDNYVMQILHNILEILFLDDYSQKYDRIDSYLLKYPEVVLDKFLNIVNNYNDNQKLAIILDDFDLVGSSSKRYQEYLYSLLKNNTKLILSVSDMDILNDENRLAELKKNNNIILISYNTDIEIIKEIIDNMYVREFLNKLSFKYRVRFIFSDEELEEIIKSCDGNTELLVKAFRYFYSKLEFIIRDKYKDFLLNYINDYYSLNANIESYKKSRTLKI